jgi:tRNA U34 5-methylaminomethyl-2-thiouridine-forming methyltransferase MnmC
MQRKLILTSDGSHTILLPESNVTYHSIHGAVQESKHVFIEAGLRSLNPAKKTIVNIFEMGFGTGLNALLTMIEAEKLERAIHYEAIEQFPLDNKQIGSLNYCTQLGRQDLQMVFEQLHHCEWEKTIKLTPKFTFKKSAANLLDFETPETWLSGPKDSLRRRQAFELIYFDAFAPNVQPELWTKEIFDKMFEMLEQGGILVTYCSKGDVRRAMQAAGFTVEKLPGPKGKREIIRAFRKK